MFKENEKNLENILQEIEKVAGWRIRKFAKHLQEDALHEAVIAYLEGVDILEHLNNWNRKERKYQRKILAFTRARPTKRDLKQIKKISEEYH